MVNDVEDILNEIRERVHRDHQHEAAPTSRLMTTRDTPPSMDLSANTNGETERVNSESLNRLSAHLTTTARAWDRLPPLYSNRTGGSARLELWIKARLKAMSRWFIWEQVNFNSAVHHALAETLHALAAYQQELAALRVELARQAEVSRAGFERGSQELTTVRAGLDAQTAELKKENANLTARNAALEARSAGIDARSTAIETRVTEIAAELTRKIDEARADLTPRLAELAGELRESDQQLREEQRVCFKQLSLEESETAVNEDRGRRLIETRLDKLEKVLSNGDK
ncbi:MAG: hypothetical protein QOH71_836 [Blastocatellia bacterium]|jgi:hypothetical protein|nr:hypothetical protein [Blastocatellia bacterium]